MSREVDSSRKLRLLIAAGGHEILAWTSWKKNKLHSTKRTTGKSLFVDHFVSTAKFCINVVSVKYNEKKKTEEILKFLNQLMNQNWQKPTYISWRSQYFRSSFFAFLLARVKFMAWNDWHFDNKLLTLSLDKCSLKEGFDLTWERTSAFWGFEVSVATKYN